MEREGQEMIAYILMCFFTCFLAWLYTKSKRTLRFRYNNGYMDLSPGIIIIYSMMILPPIYIAGFRYGIGVDYFNVYQSGFQEIIYLGSSNGFEWGFNVLSVLLSKIYASSEFLFFAFSTITIVFYFLSFKESKNFFISVVLLFGTGAFFDSFNGIRQYLVVAIFMYAFKYIKARDIKRYMIIMGLCVLIHTSAIISLPLYFLNRIKLNVKKLIIVLAAVFIARDYLYDGVMYIMELIPKYNMYIIRDTIQNQISFSTSGLVMALIALVPCLLVNKKMQEESEGRFLYNMVMLGLTFAVCSAFLPLAERLMYYTRSYFIFSIPYACSLIKNENKRNLAQFGTSFIMIAMNFIGIAYLGWYAVLPYTTIFSH